MKQSLVLLACVAFVAGVPSYEPANPNDVANKPAEIDAYTPKVDQEKPYEKVDAHAYGEQGKYKNPHNTDHQPDTSTYGEKKSAEEAKTTPSYNIAAIPAYGNGTGARTGYDAANPSPVVTNYPTSTETANQGYDNSGAGSQDQAYNAYSGATRNAMLQIASVVGAAISLYFVL